MTTSFSTEQQFRLQTTCPRLLRYMGRETGICPLSGSLMVKCPFPQAFTMADSPGCCSVWARCLHCLYSCHWRKQKMPTSKVERGCGRRQTRRQRLLGGNTETHCIRRQLGGRGFLSPRKKISLRYWKTSSVQSRKLGCHSGVSEHKMEIS